MRLSSRLVSDRDDAIAGKPPPTVRCLVRDSATLKSGGASQSDAADSAFLQRETRYLPHQSLNFATIPLKDVASRESS